MEALFKIIYNGRLKPGADRDRFVAQFSKQFGVSEAQALQLSDAGKEVVIKKNVKPTRAHQYVKMLDEMGMEVRLETMSGEAVGDPTPSPSPAPAQPASAPPPPPPKAPPAGVDDNPYAAPEADLYDEAEAGDMTGPVTVPVGHGWSWISRGFWHFKQNIGPWIGAFIIWFVIAIVLSLIPFIGSLALIIISPVITAGFMLGAREQEEGGDFTIGHLFAGFANNSGQLMLVGVLYFVGSLLIGVVIGGMMAATLAGGMAGMGAMEPGAEPNMNMIGGGMILMVLLMLALMIPLVMAYWFAPALVALEDMSAISAMRSSFMACLKNILPFLVYGLILIVLMIIAAIPFGLGLLILIPVLMASMYASYRDIYYGPLELD